MYKTVGFVGILFPDSLLTTNEFMVKGFEFSG